MCYMTRQLLPSPSEGALIRAGGRGEPSAPLPFWAAERTPERVGTRLPTDPCPLGSLFVPLSGKGKLRFPSAPSERGVRAAPGPWARVKASGRFARGAGSGMGFAAGAFGVLLIPPHRLKERARNFTPNRTCSVFRRTSA